MAEERVSVRQDGHLLSRYQSGFFEGISLCVCAEAEVPKGMHFNIGIQERVSNSILIEVEIL